MYSKVWTRKNIIVNAEFNTVTSSAIRHFITLSIRTLLLSGKHGYVYYFHSTLNLIRTLYDSTESQVPMNFLCTSTCLYLSSRFYNQLCMHVWYLFTSMLFLAIKIWHMSFCFDQTYRSFNKLIKSVAGSFWEQQWGHAY